MRRITMVGLLSAAVGVAIWVYAPVQAGQSIAEDGSMAAAKPVIWTPVEVEAALVRRTNQDRLQFGLPPLEDDPALLQIARARAASQLGDAPLTHEDADGHPTLARLFRDAGIQYVIAGENLARMDLGDPNLVDHVEQALMDSTGHRENLLRPEFTRMAVGIATSDRQIVFAETYRTLD